MIHKQGFSLDIRNKSRSKWLWALLILSSCIGCDQATKVIATRTLQNQPPISLLADTIRLDYALNPGGFLSLGSTLPQEFRTGVFITLNVCLLGGLAGYLLWQRKMPLSLYAALVFILAGGIGNLIDRVGNNGLVTDFINVGIGPLRTGVFNVADMAVTFGAIAVACVTWKQVDGDESAQEPASLK